jgi:excisionase family DNA binding protein
MRAIEASTSIVVYSNLSAFERGSANRVIERHYKTRELAEPLGLHPETIRRAAQRGELESVRIGLDRIYSESAVQRWLDTNRKRTPLVAAVRRAGDTAASATRREVR